MPTTRPTYDLLHGGHDRNDPRYAEVGHDVVHSYLVDGQLVLEVTDYIDGADNYLTALEAAKAHRTQPGHYGYTATRYACGCRWIATSVDDDRVLFLDLVTA
jgi:hypothetical protein